MISFTRFLSFLSLLTLLAFCFTYVTFAFWNKDLQAHYGLKCESLHKGFMEDLQNIQGESVSYSLPIKYVSELCIDLVGEDLFIEQQAGLDKILVEVFYAPTVSGQTYSKIDYQLLSHGDRASFVCDKTLWRHWKPQDATQRKLMCGYVHIKIPTDLRNLKVFNTYGLTKIQGSYQQFKFLSYTGDLFFKGNIVKAKLESFKGTLSLEGRKEQAGHFQELIFKTIKGKLVGRGEVEFFNLYGLSTSFFWQGICKKLSAKALHFNSQFVIENINKEGSWSISALSGDFNVQLPKGCKRELKRGIWQRKYLLGAHLELNLPVSLMGFSCKV